VLSEETALEKQESAEAEHLIRVAAVAAHIAAWKYIEHEPLCFMCSCWQSDRPGNTLLAQWVRGDLAGILATGGPNGPNKAPDNGRECPAFDEESTTQ